MVDTSSNVVGDYNSEEFVDLDEDARKEAVQAEVDEIAGDDGIDEDEQEEIDTLLSNIDEVGAAWDELLEGLEDTDEDDMTDAELAQKEGYEDEAKEIMDVLQEAITIAEDEVDTINESVIEIGDDGGNVTADEDTDHDLTVQLDGSSTPFTDTDDDDVIHFVSDDETNILESGRIPIYIDTPPLSASPTSSGSDLVFTYEGKDENGDVATRTITIKGYDPSKCVIYFQGDSITQDIVDNGTLASWPTDVLGSSVWDDDTVSLLVRVNGPSAWDEFEDLTSDENINQAIGYIPEAAGLSEVIKSSWETLWQGHIDGDVDGAWAEVVGQYSGDQQKALIEAMVVSMSLDADLVEFFPTFFDSYGITLQGLLDVDYENPTTSGLTALMLIEENTTAGASLGGDLLYPETLFGSEGLEDMGEVKNPDIAIESINNIMDIQAIAGQSYASSLDDALEIQEGISEDGGYFNLSDDQYDTMIDQVMMMTAAEGSGLTDTELRNALVQAVAQLQEMGTTTVEDARTNILTIVNGLSSLGGTYGDDVMAGLLHLLMNTDDGSGTVPSAIYVSVVDDYTFMAQIEPIINNGSGEPIYFDEIKDDFKSRGYEFEVIEEPTTIVDTWVDGALLGAGAGFLVGGPIGAVIGFFVGGNWDESVNNGSSIGEVIVDWVVDAFTFG